MAAAAVVVQRERERTHLAKYRERGEGCRDGLKGKSSAGKGTKHSKERIDWRKKGKQKLENKLIFAFIGN